MARKKVIDKQFKLDAVQYRKDHPELTFEQVAKNLGISNSSNSFFDFTLANSLSSISG